MFSNCRRYNEEGSMIYEDAIKLQKVLMDRVKELGPLTESASAKKATPKTLVHNSFFKNLFRWIFKCNSSLFISTKKKSKIEFWLIKSNNFFCNLKNSASNNNNYLPISTPTYSTIHSWLIVHNLAHIYSNYTS